MMTADEKALAELKEHYKAMPLDKLNGLSEAIKLLLDDLSFRAVFEQEGLGYLNTTMDLIIRDKREEAEAEAFQEIIEIVGFKVKKGMKILDTWYKTPLKAEIVSAGVTKQPWDGKINKFLHIVYEDQKGREGVRVKEPDWYIEYFDDFGNRIATFGERAKT